MASKLTCIFSPVSAVTLSTLPTNYLYQYWMGFSAAFNLKLKIVKLRTVNSKARPVLRTLPLLIKLAIVAGLCLITIKENMSKSE